MAKKLGTVYEYDTLMSVGKYEEATNLAQANYEHHSNLADEWLEMVADADYKAIMQGREEDNG